MLLDRQSLLNTASEVSSQTFDEGLGQLDLTTREPRRSMSIISTPYFTPSGHSVHWGFYCTRCIDNMEPAMHFRSKYTEDGFVDYMARDRTNHGGEQ